MQRVEGFGHRPGNHCGSTSLRNLADFYGWGFDEPTAFGLASGLGFTYYELPESPHRAFFGRPLWLEVAFFEHLGVGFEHRVDDDWEHLWSRLRETIDGDDPVMLFTDIFSLDYYDTDTHFAPHSLLAIGYDDDRVLLADSEFEEPQWLPAGRLRAAVGSEYVQPAPNRSLVVTDPDPAATLAAAAPGAIVETARYMLDPATASHELGPGEHGLDGVRAFAAELPSYTDLPDPHWTVRFAYQNVERRGTGGGAFRRMYADFLAAAAESVPSIPDGVGERMGEIASDWTVVGGTLKTASECDEATDMEPLLAETADIVFELADREQRLYEDLLDAV